MQCVEHSNQCCVCVCFSAGGGPVWLALTQSSSRGRCCVCRRPGEASESAGCSCGGGEQCWSSRHAGGESCRRDTRPRASYRPSGGASDRDADSCSSAAPPSRSRPPAGGSASASGQYTHTKRLHCVKETHLCQFMLSLGIKPVNLILTLNKYLLVIIKWINLW